jgi:hypothetical protein
MPRKSRIDAAGVLHNIMVRGIERKKVFRSDTDRDQFFERLGMVLWETLIGTERLSPWFAMSLSLQRNMNIFSHLLFAMRKIGFVISELNPTHKFQCGLYRKCSHR